MASYQSAQDFREAAAKRRKTKDVEVPGCGMVRLRTLSAGDAQQFQAEVKKCAAAGEDAEGLAFSLIARSWIGADGDLWLPEEEGIVLAKSLDPETYNVVAKEVLKLNGLSGDAVDSAVKTSGASLGDITHTDSPASLDSPTSI